jgi:hypothetical protein
VRTEHRTSTAAKILYRPVGLVGSLVGGLLAGAIFKQIWRRTTHTDDAPKALESEYSMREVLIAATVQGAIFAVVKAAVHRGSAAGARRLTGEWPG